MQLTPISLGLTRLGRNAPAVDLEALLFGSGEQGVIFDASDLSTMWQDAAGTIAAAVDQPVRRWASKVNGHVATQPTAGVFPYLRRDGNGLLYLQFDGVDDSINTGTITLAAGVNNVAAWAGVHNTNDGATGAIAEYGPTANTTAGTFGLFSRLTTSSFGLRYAGATPFIDIYGPSTPAPTTRVLTATVDLGGGGGSFRVNGGTASTNASVAGGGDFSSQSLRIGRRNATNIPFRERVYALVIRFAASTADQIAQTEAWVNARTGAY
jgi:hypothetical protein